MGKSLFYSLIFHSVMILLTVLSLPFMLREPIDLPPIVSVELIQITDKTSIPYAPKARKIIEETKKKEEERLVSEQAPPAAKAKEKPDRIPLPNENKEEKQIIKKKNSKPINFNIRFHLYPGLTAVKTMSGDSVLIQLSKNKSLIFTVLNETIRLEKSIFLGSTKILDNTCVTVSGNLVNKDKVIHWEIKKKI